MPWSAQKTSIDMESTFGFSVLCTLHKVAAHSSKTPSEFAGFASESRYFCGSIVKLDIGPLKLRFNLQAVAFESETMQSYYAEEIVVLGR